MVTVKEAQKSTTPDVKLAVFSLDQVTLKTNAYGQETKFMENRDKFVKTLATTDPNSFLYMFRHAFGQKQPAGATPLGVWDSQDTKLRGHATGHYLTAIAQAYAGTGNDPALQATFSQKMEQMVNTLYDLSLLSGQAQKAGRPQVSDPAKVPTGPGKSTYDSDLSEEGIRRDYWNWGVGYISAYPPDQFIMLEKGAKYGGQKNQIWAPYYTLHKILAGLLDVYEVSGNKKALAVAAGMGDWVYGRLSQVPTDTLIKMWNTYIAGEFGGMNEAMARMYRLTGKPTHLKAAQLFDNIRVFYGDPAHSHGLAKNVDLFRGLHANQHIPQIVGSMEMYRASHNPEYYKIADNFWYKTVNEYMYSIGGVAGARNPNNAECFIAQPGTLYENGFSSGGQNETCATYNMLKLTRDLFLFEQKAELMDYYERGLYNHILASVAKDSPANTYHVPLRPGSLKQFSNGDMTGFTCCNGTALESSTKLQNSIYFKSKDNTALYVNLYVPSTLTWAERNVKVEQTTNFPHEDRTRLIIKGKGKFEVNVRVPGRATKGFFVKINGKEQKLEAKPGSYLPISRSWKEGDVIELRMPFQFHLDPVMDQQNIASLFYGPILLAAQEPEARKEWRKVTLHADDLGKSIKGDPQQLQFTIDGTVFKPFYDTYGRHSVYLDVTLK
ncbi:glycoside hydrolase family 127 protein [Rufibacter soli]